MAILVVLHAGRVVALAEFLPVFIDQQAEMGELWGLPTKCLVQLNMFWGGNEPLLRTRYTVSSGRSEVKV